MKELTGAALWVPQIVSYRERRDTQTGELVAEVELMPTEVRAELLSYGNIQFTRLDDGRLQYEVRNINGRVTRTYETYFQPVAPEDREMVLLYLHMYAPEQITPWLRGDTDELNQA